MRSTRAAGGDARTRRATLALLLSLAMPTGCRVADKLVGDDAGDGKARHEALARRPHAGTYGPSDR